MRSATAAFVLAFIVTTLVTPFVRKVALRAGVVDQPGGRRAHIAVTPRLGGVAVMAGFFVPLAAFALVKTAMMRSFLDRPDLVIGLVLGAAVVGLVGAVDDVRSLGPWMKLAAQAVAACVAYAFGYRIEGFNIPLLGEVTLGAFALPVTVLWFIGITNAVNLIDGLDGLAAGIALFTTLANLVIGGVRESAVVLLLSGSLGGALLGFLRYNFNPATIFLGDSGSMFLGFTLAATAIAGELTKSSTAVTLLAPVLALGVPIVDTLLAMVRRTLARQSIFAADRGHIHHILLDLGLTHRRVVLTLYGMSVALALAAVSVAIGHATEIGIALAGVGAVLFVIVRAAARRRSAQRRATSGHPMNVGDSTPQALALENLKFTADESQLRLQLQIWSEASGGLQAELRAGEAHVTDSQIDEQCSTVFDVSSPSRRRHLYVSSDKAASLRSEDGRLVVEVAELVRACTDAVARLGTHAGSASSGAIHAVSIHAPGAKK